MLVLSRKLNESIVIDGRIVVTIVRVEGDVVKLGIQASRDVPVHRQEVYEEIQKANQEALTKGRPAVPKLAQKPSPPSAATPHRSTENSKPAQAKNKLTIPKES
jgi:carbon storage regulator